MTATTTNIFEQATKKKVRIQTSKGTMMVEDLWQADLNELDTIASKLRRELADTNESLLPTKVEKGDGAEIKQLQYDLIVHIVKARLAEKEAKANQKADAARRQVLLAEQERRQGEKLTNLSDAELEAELAKTK